MSSTLVIGIIAILKYNGVKLDSDILSELVEKFIECGIEVSDLEDCYGVDDELDLVLDEVCSLKFLDKDEDDWPDGGREDF